MIVADTGAILASIDASAAEHKQCADLVQHADSPMLVSHMVVAETDYLLTKRFGIATANQFLSDVATGAFQLVPTNERDLQEAVTVNTRYSDQMLGVTDCLNVVLAWRYGTIKLFTLDEQHFRVVRPLAHGDTFQLLPVDQKVA